MAKAEIYTANTSTQAVAVNGIITPGTIIRRFGNTRCCNPAINVANNGISLNENGYYRVLVNVTAEPTEEGAVTVALYQDGVAYPGAVATNTAAAASDAVSVCIPADVKVTNCNSILTVVLTAGAGNVTNVGIAVNKL